jgi:hypothetical protein
MCAFKQGLRVLPLLLAMVVVLGCGGEDDPSSQQGDLVVKASFPTAAQVGQNTMMVLIEDAKGQPVSGATVSVDPQMPHHGHGSTETPVVTDKGAGSYEAFPVTLQMPGMWTITVNVTHGAKTGTQAMQVDVP